MENMRNYVPNIDDKKLETVLEIKNAYDSGRMSLEEAKRLLREKVKTLTPAEIALSEQELKEFEDDECRKENIQKTLLLFEDIMDTSRPALPDDHPLMRYYRENDVVLGIMQEIEDLVQYPLIKNQWLEIYDRLSKYKIHFSRKQNQLYSLLERKGFDRPTKTMWTLDDFVRDEIKNARALLDADQDDAFIAAQAAIIADVRDLAAKENAILYPTALVLIRPDEFEDMKEGDREIGFAWIEGDADTRDAANAPENKNPDGVQDGFTAELMQLLQKYGYATGFRGERLPVSTGNLTLEQINLIYKHLPVDISYVDENELVCFYSDTAHRVFPRSKNVIGRDVKNCHPRASVHIVEEIIEKFRSGEENSAEFWINKPDLFIYILYVAVRDSEGKFKGVLEMMQDCTHIRSLEGSQTLLTWGSGKKNTDAPNETNDTTEKTTDSLQAVSANLLPLKAETRLSDLLSAYPWLKSELPSINSAFKMLQTPLARIMIPKATVQIMSERSQMPLDELTAAIEERIKAHEQK